MITNLVANVCFFERGLCIATVSMWRVFSYLSIYLGDGVVKYGLHSLVPKTT